ncbi:ParA family protein [Planomonospora sp. ID82291]|uniref:ParA family protein n=1 Tax=Planomonospora sp. ID82291 TaxID=2738136 RepID=UPI0018C3EC08|nr:ParA family protein [Planomonospora sp. ID82291]MBG0818744.1 ParA family protein [Planomonospora sp. ID82291]
MTTPHRGRRYPKGPLVIAVANEGGGTRKTTASVNLAVAMAVAGKKVAVMDCDSTMNASCYLGYGVTDKKKHPERAEAVHARLAQMTSIHHVLHGTATLAEAMVPARTRIASEGDGDDSFKVIENLWLVLGSREIAFASHDIRDSRYPKANDTWVRRAIASLPEGMLDVLILDFRGSYDTWETTLLGGADFVIGALKPEAKDDDTLTTLRSNLAHAQEAYEFSDGAADLRYVLLNGVSGNRGNYYIEQAREITEFYGSMMLPPIAEAVSIGESYKAQEPVYFWLGPNEKPTKEFDAAARAIKEVWAA